jgi:hypothetical protein
VGVWECRPAPDHPKGGDGGCGSTYRPLSVVSTVAGAPGKVEALMGDAEGWSSSDDRPPAVERPGSRKLGARTHQDRGGVMTNDGAGLARRRFLARSAVAAGLVWTAPAVRSVRLGQAEGTPPPNSTSWITSPPESSTTTTPESTTTTPESTTTTPESTTTTPESTTPSSGTVKVPRTPSTKDECKNDGWRDLVDSEGRPFPNQGQCVSFVERQSHR